MNSPDEFKPRPEAIDNGRDYEHYTISYIILNLINNPEIINFKIASNDENFGAFDDVILELEYKDGKMVEYAIQLKHVHQKKFLAGNSLISEVGRFSIPKYFASYKKHLKNRKTKMIIFTNYKWDNNLKFCLGSSILRSVQNKTDPLLNTSTNETCVKFQIQEDKCDEREELEQFFDNFWFYANQAGTSKMKRLISQKFRESFLCDEDSCERYLQFIVDWSKKDGKKNKLNKNWVQQAIAIRLLSPYIIPIKQEQVFKEKFLHLRRIIEAFNITIFQEETNLNMERVWSDAEDHLKNLDALNKIRLKFFLKINHIMDLNGLRDLERTQLLWLMGKIPLIVPENEVVLQTLELYKEGKFILVRKSESDKVIRHNSVFNTLSDLSQKSEIGQDITQAIKCSVQGEEITLESLLDNHQNLTSTITPNELFRMLDEEVFVIGGTKEELPKPHIERKLSKTVIDLHFLQQIAKAEQKMIIVLSCNNHLKKIENYLTNFKLVQVDDHLQNSSKSSDADVYISDGECSQEDFDKLCNKNAKVKQCHHFRVTEDGNLEWLKSKGIIDELEPFLLRDHSIDESELCDLQPGNNINIICANPGMGKSILARSLKNKLASKYWPILIHPTDVSAYFRKKDGIAFDEYIVMRKSKKYNKFDKSVMESFKQKNLITYIWDGLDEISDENFKKVPDIIDNLSKKNILQWITSRYHLQEKLEKRFKIFSRTILQFDEEQQESFIKQRLEDVCRDDIQDIIGKIKENIKIIRCHEVLGIPLQIFMLTELFRQDTDKYSKLLNNIFSLTDLYQHFVNEKFNNHYKEKAKIEYPNHHLKQILEAYKESYVKKYEKAALRTLEEKDASQIRNVDCEKFLEKIKDECDSFGLITEVSDSMTPTFVHNSYGEFFVASYFFKNHGKIKNLKHILFKERYTNIRFLFDLLMAKDSPVHIAVLYKNLDVLRNEESQLHLLDQGGRNALQVACTWGQKYPLLKTTLCEEETNTYQIDEKPGESVEEEDTEYQNMIIYLSEKCDCRVIDKLFKMDSASYADKALCMFPLIHFSQKKNLSIDKLSKFKDMGTLLYYGIKFDCVQIIDLIKDTPFIKTQKRNLSLLHLCAEFNSTQCLAHLLKMENYKSVIDSVDIFDVFPTTIACKKGHDKILKMLMESGADLSCNVFQLIKIACKGGHHEVLELLLKFLRNSGISINKDTKTVTASFQTSCLSGYGKIVQLLVDFEANINVNTRHGTPLYIACQYGHKEIVKILVNGGADLKKDNKFCFTPLHIACQRNHVEIVQLLIDFGANVNVGDKTGITPLHVVSKNGNGDILTLLINAKVELNQTNKKGMTALCNACHCGNERIVEMLAEAGADVNLACNEGAPIHLACEKGRVDIVKLLLRYSVDINVENEKYELPLKIAEKNGFQEIVDMLTNSAKGDFVENVLNIQV